MDGDRGHVELPDQPELYTLRDTALPDAYASVLAREPWHWFATLTFRRDHERNSGGVHPEKADKAYRFFVRCLNEYLYGPRWMRTPHGGVIWARGQEFHKDGKVHFHSVLAAPDRDLNLSASRYHWHEFWFKEFGRNQIERPRDQDEVVGYVSKYVTKDGEVDFSHNFGRVTPPSLFERTPAVSPTSLAPVETRIGRLMGGTQKRTHLGASLSLTPPLRPAIEQRVFSDETFYHLPTEGTDQ